MLTLSRNVTTLLCVSLSLRLLSPPLVRAVGVCHRSSAPCHSEGNRPLNACRDTYEGDPVAAAVNACRDTYEGDPVAVAVLHRETETSDPLVGLALPELA